MNEFVNYINKEREKTSRNIWIFKKRRKGLATKRETVVNVKKKKGGAGTLVAVG